MADNKEWTINIPGGFTGLFTDVTGFPPIIGTLIGETVYNLRAALDYLVYELAILDSGKAQVRTQFPLESCEDRWREHERTWLRGISDVHKASIKGLQPFKGVVWTATLRDLSNPDKHRRLTIGFHGPSVRVIANAARKSQTVGPALDKPMQMDSEIAYVILFQDQTPVIEVLKTLQQQISGVIDAFEPEFK